MSSFLLGIDIGGTNVRFVLYHEDKNIISCVKKMTFQKLGDSKLEVEENLCKPIEQIINQQRQENKELVGIGVSLAALFNRHSGDITVWPNNKTWNGFPLKDYLTKRFNVPVILEDDANSAAMGEHLAGEGKGYSSFAYITISTGIGCGLVLNNSLYIGANGWAGEIGHIKIIEDGAECSCGATGCLQSAASGPALLKKFKQTNNQDTTRLEDVVSLAYKGVAEARAVFEEGGAHIGKMIANLVMILDLPLIVLGGGVTEAGDILLMPISDAVSTCLNKFNRDVKVKSSQLGDDNGAIGALSLIYKYTHKDMMLQFEDFYQGWG